MFKSKFQIILPITLLFFSCGNVTTHEIEVFEEDNFISRVDSILNIADEELEHIQHDNVEDERIHNELIITANKLESLVNIYKKQLNEKNELIDILTDEVDSLVLTNFDKLDLIENQKYIINNLEEKLKYKDINHREQVVQYEAELYRLSDSLITLNDSLYKVIIFINDNVRQSKRGDYIINEE